MRALSAAVMIIVVGLFVRALVAQQPRYRSLASGVGLASGAGDGRGLVVASDDRSSRPDQLDRPGSPSAEIELYSVSAGTLVRQPPRAQSEAAWHQELAPEAYFVLRQKGTERAFTGSYWNHHGSGVYKCAGCGADLFLSTTKYDSGSGWPSFWSPVHPANITTEIDRSLGLPRVEILCTSCGGHLGHVFEDGPRPTGLRYCVNSAALRFVEHELPPEPSE